MAVAPWSLTMMPDCCASTCALLSMIAASSLNVSGAPRNPSHCADGMKDLLLLRTFCSKLTDCCESYELCVRLT